MVKTKTRPKCVQKTAATVAIEDQIDTALSGRGDEELRSVCAEFDAMDRLFTEIFNSNDDDDVCAARWAPYEARQRRLKNHLVSLRASTLEGHRARARSLISFSIDYAQLESEGGVWSDEIAGAIFRDLAMEEGQSARPQEEPDAEIIALCHDVIENERALEAAFKAEADDRITRELDRLYFSLTETLCALPAKTQAGQNARLNLLANLHGRDGTIKRDADFDQRIVLALVRDFAGLTVVERPEVVPKETKPVQVESKPAPPPRKRIDDELLTLCEQFHKARLDAQEKSAISTAADDKDKVLVDAWDAAHDAMNEIAERILPLKTDFIVGLREKALVARCIIDDMRGPLPANNFDEKYSDAVINNVIEMFGVAP